MKIIDANGFLNLQKKNKIWGTPAASIQTSLKLVVVDLKTIPGSLSCLTDG